MLLPVSTPLSYAVIAPIVRALSVDPRIEVVVSARHGGVKEARRFLDAPFSYERGIVASLRRYDLAVCSGFYFHSRRSLCAIEMFHGVSPKNYAVRKEATRFDHLFLIGEYHRRKFVRASLLSEEDERAWRVGMPKTDRLVHPDDDALSFIDALPIDRTRPTVLYAPTRSGSAGSSLEEGAIRWIDRLVERPVNVLVKLHDRSQRRYRTKLRHDFESELAERERAGRLVFVRHHDVIPLLLAADLLVSDLSSVASEFLLLDRPIVYLSTPAHEEKIRRSACERFGADDPEDLDYLRATGPVVGSERELLAAVDEELACPKGRSAVRHQRAAQLFYNPGRATERAVDAIYQILNLEAP